MGELIFSHLIVLLAISLHNIYSIIIKFGKLCKNDAKNLEKLCKKFEKNFAKNYGKNYEINNEKNCENPFWNLYLL